jgi:hypothetical protein
MHKKLFRLRGHIVKRGFIEVRDNRSTMLHMKSILL